MKKLKLTYKYYDYIEEIDKKLIIIAGAEPDEDGMLKVYSLEGNPDRLLQPFSSESETAFSTSTNHVSMAVTSAQIRYVYITLATGLLNWYGWGKMVDDALYLSNTLVNEQLKLGFMKGEAFEDDDETIKYYDEQFDKEGTVLAKKSENTEEEQKEEKDS